MDKKETELNESIILTSQIAQKLQADELFFEGKMEEATKLFSEIDALNNHNEFSSLRWKWFNGLDSLQENTFQLSLQLKAQLAKCQELISERDALIELANSETEQNKASIASLEKRLANQFDSLSTKFAKEKEALGRQSKNDTLSFLSSKNYKIRFYGQVASGKATGIGAGFWSTGGYYFGEWKNNQRNGKGIYYWKDGERYEGEYVNDSRQGIGKYFWNNGEKYEGSWKNDQRNGFGTLYDAMGKVKFKGEWVNDVPKE